MLTIKFLIFLLINSLLTYTTFKNGLVFYENRKKLNKIHPKIFDISYKYLPDLTDNKFLSIILNIIVFTSPFIIEFIFGYKILDEYIYYFFIIYIIRSIFINVTILPKIKKCNNNFNFISFLNGQCYDKIFSGHFASFFLLILILYKNKIYTNIPVLSLSTFIIALFILLTRSHYSVDILTALFVVITIYYNFPRYIN